MRRPWTQARKNERNGHDAKWDVFDFHKARRKDSGVAARTVALATGIGMPNQTMTRKGTILPEAAA
ncbi:hypothetical protein [Kibdelosporangium philippinense]|uniref:hypothetical protein n=1 Tax=Kibdelosporangium philippinense TaxID=211113 RepID=UPI0036188FBE